VGFNPSPNLISPCLGPRTSKITHGKINRRRNENEKEEVEGEKGIKNLSWLGSFWGIQSSPQRKNCINDKKIESGM